MRYIGILKGGTRSTTDVTSDKDLLEKMGRFMEEVAETIILPLHDLYPSPLGARVKLAAGRFTVTAGRYTETKGTVVPCAMFDVDSMLEAVQWTASLLRVLGEGECEIRPLYEDRAVASA